MNKQFLYVDYEKTKIDDKEFIVVYVLEFYSKQVFKIYKLFNTDLVEELNVLDKFENINDKVCIAIKRNGKISLDIKL